MVRLAAPADLEAVSRLFDEYRVFYELASDIGLSAGFLSERFRNGDSLLLVGENEGRPAGFCQLYPTFCSLEAGRIFVLYDLYVEPASRKTGLGRALLKFAEQAARERGAVRLDLTTAKTNHTAQRLYESLGWVQDEVFFTYTRKLL